MEELESVEELVVVGVLGGRYRYGWMEEKKKRSN